MESKVLEDLKAKLKSIQSKINSKNNKIEKKNEEIKFEKAEIQRVEATRKGDDSKFEAFNEMVDQDIKNRNKDILKKEEEIKQEKENIAKLEEERKETVQNAKSDVKKDLTKKMVQINKLNNKVKGLKESARKVKQAKLATTDKSVYKANDEEHKFKIEEIKKVYKEKNEIYKEYQENQKALDEIEKIEKEVLENESPVQAKKVEGKEDDNLPDWLKRYKKMEDDEKRQGTANGEPVKGGEGVAVEGPENENPVKGGEGVAVEGPENENPVKGGEGVAAEGPVNEEPVKGGEEKFTNSRKWDEIKKIEMSEYGYQIFYKNEDEPIEYEIPDELLDRQEKEKYRKELVERYPDIKKIKKKIDLGLVKILLEHEKNEELCKIYFNSLKEGQMQPGLPVLNYNLEKATSFGYEDERFARRNAINNRKIAKVNGLTKNPFIRAYDFISEKADDLENWFDNMKTKFLPAPEEKMTNYEVEGRENGDSKRGSFREDIRIGAPTAGEQARYAKEAGERVQGNATEVNLESKGKEVGED